MPPPLAEVSLPLRTHGAPPPSAFEARVAKDRNRYGRQERALSETQPHRWLCLMKTAIPNNQPDSPIRKRLRMYLASRGAFLWHPRRTKIARTREGDCRQSLINFYRESLLRTQFTENSTRARSVAPYHLAILQTFGSRPVSCTANVHVSQLGHRKEKSSRNPDLVHRSRYPAIGQ